MNKLWIVFLLWLPFVFTTGCSSAHSSVPKSRFLATGQTTPEGYCEDDGSLCEERVKDVEPCDRYRTDADRVITHRIRAAICADELLSHEGDRISIITIRGNVTLRGSVHTEKDKTAVGLKAQEIAGTGNVSNQLTVVGY